MNAPKITTNCAPPPAKPRRVGRVLMWCALGGAAALELGALLRLPRLVYVSQVVCEDAFYYIVPALNGAHAGSLSLDGRNDSNGFHPLWMLCNLLAALLSHDRFVVMYAVSLGGLAAALGGFLCLARAAGGGGVARVVLFAFLFLSPLGKHWLCGMETGLAFLLLCLVYVQIQKFEARPPSTGRLVLLGAAMGLAILARLDYLPLMVWLGALLTCATWQARDGGGLGVALRRAALLVGVTALVVAPYGIWNYVSFGMVAPISSVCKRFYAQSVHQAGLLWLPQNLAGFFENCGALAGVTGPAWALALGVVLVVGGVRLLRRTRRTSCAALLLTLGVLAWPALHAVIYCFVLGHFARDAYINWYFAPEILVAGVLLAEGGAALGVRRMWTPLLAPLAGVAVAAPFAYVGLAQIRTLHGSVELALFVRAALCENAVLPPGARIAAFSAGTQAFLARDGRTVTNLDGLINTPRFYEQHLRTGRLADYLAAEGITYFSDAVADLQTGDLVWHGARIGRERFDVLMQAGTWAGTVYNLARLRAPGEPSGALPFTYRQGAELGEYFLESAGRSAQQPAQYDADGALLFPVGDAPATNGFGAFAVEPGYYRAQAQVRVDQRAAGLSADAPLFRVVFASWREHATYAERVVAARMLPADAAWADLDLVANVPAASAAAEIRIQKLAPGCAVHLARVGYFRYRAPPAPRTAAEVIAAGRRYNSSAGD